MTPLTDWDATHLQIGQKLILPGGSQPGTSFPSPTPGTTSNINWVNFSGTVGPSIGVNLRYSPRFGDRSSWNEPNGKTLEFDAWTYGETGTDMWTGQSDNRWFKIKGKDLWVPSCWIYGNPPKSGSSSGSESVGSVTIEDKPINKLQQPSHDDYQKLVYRGAEYWCG